MESFKRALRLSPLDPLGGYFSGGVAIVYAALGRYDEALEWADRTLHEFPNYPGAIRSKLVAFAQLGHIEEARDELKKLMALDSKLTIAKWRATAGQYAPPNVMAVAVDSFRKTGMREE